MRHCAALRFLSLTMLPSQFTNEPADSTAPSPRLGLIFGKTSYLNLRPGMIPGRSAFLPEKTPLGRQTTLTYHRSTAIEHKQLINSPRPVSHLVVKPRATPNVSNFVGTRSYFFYGSNYWANSLLATCEIQLA